MARGASRGVTALAMAQRRHRQRRKSIDKNSRDKRWAAASAAWRKSLRQRCCAFLAHGAHRATRNIAGFRSRTGRCFSRVGITSFARSASRSARSAPRAARRA